jgi:hypothetical protein
MTELRISRYRWEMFSEELQEQFKLNSMYYATDMGYNHEYEYYWLTFSPEQVLLSKLSSPELWGNIL